MSLLLDDNDASSTDGDDVQTTVSSKPLSVVKIEGNGCVKESSGVSGLMPVIALLLDDDDASSTDGLVCESDSSPTPIATNSPGRFYGKLALSNGVAPAGGVEIEFKTSPLDFSFSGLTVSVTLVNVEIPEGQSEACYSLDLFQGGMTDTSSCDLNVPKAVMT